MPRAQFIMLTVYEDNNRLFKSLVAGASGYLLKRTTPAKLLSAIREARDGGSPMTPQIPPRVVQHFYHASQPDAGSPRPTAPETAVLNQLPPRFRYKKILDNLNIPALTLNSYILAIYE